MTHTTLEHGQGFQWGKHRATVARAVNSAIAQLLARGSILIPPLGIRVQLGQDELTILRHVAQEPNPVAKAEESQAEGASSGVSQGPHGAAAEGSGVKQSLQQVPTLQQVLGQRGSSGAQLCTVVVFRPLCLGRELSIALSSSNSDLPPPPALQAATCASEWAGRQLARDIAAMWKHLPA